ncbi:MAG: class I SAM-dependent methyltransferase [Candidatus Krumholzibacteriia bacterium]
MTDQLRQLLTRAQPPRPWVDGTKIPWHDPEFSRRVLAVHLDPDTHMASRSPEVIDAHVEWLRELLSAEDPPAGGRPVHVLDLGCGPGGYGLRLAAAGLRATGIDFGPAAVAHAREEAAAAGLDHLVEVIEADLAELPADLPDRLGEVDVATFWFAEFHSFAPAQARRLLADVAHVVRPGGLLVLEHMPWHLFVQDTETSWETCERSVFSDRPHLWLQEHHWDADARAEITVHWIVDLARGTVDRHAQCHQAYGDHEWPAMLADAGWIMQDMFPPITGVDEQLEFPVLVARRRAD